MPLAPYNYLILESTACPWSSWLWELGPRFCCRCVANSSYVTIILISSINKGAVIDDLSQLMRMIKRWSSGRPLEVESYLLHRHGSLICTRRRRSMHIHSRARLTFELLITSGSNSTASLGV